MKMADYAPVSCSSIVPGTLFAYKYPVGMQHVCVWLGRKRYLQNGRIRIWHSAEMWSDMILVRVETHENEAE